MGKRIHYSDIAPLVRYRIETKLPLNAYTLETESFALTIHSKTASKPYPEQRSLHLL